MGKTKAEGLVMEGKVGNEKEDKKGLAWRFHRTMLYVKMNQDMQMMMTRGRVG